MKNFRNGKLDYRRVFENKNGEYSPNTEKKALRYWESTFEAELDRKMEAREKDE